MQQTNGYRHTQMASYRRQKARRRRRRRRRLVFITALLDKKESLRAFFFIEERMKLMLIGYVRVSTAEQNSARQEVLMRELGVEKVYLDKASGKNANRPQLQEMLSFARQGDTIVVESISRFARNTRDLLELMEQLNVKGIGFVSKKEAIDTTTPTGKFMLTVFAAVAELEREYILQRQREGIAIAKQAGKYKGRKPIDRTELQPVLEEYRKGNLTATQAMRKMNVSKSTFYRMFQQKNNESSKRS